MEEDGSFIFHEGNYLQSSFSAFQDMRIKLEHTDVVIKARNREFPAHRVVLAARIPHFRSILSTHEKEVLLNEIEPDVLESLINFAYEGKIKITAANVQPMFFAAVCLHLKQVQQVCLNFLANRFSSNTDPATSSFIKVIPSEDNIRDKFEEFCKSEEFLFMPYYAVKELLSRNDLKVKNEEKVFEALMKWTKVSLVERQHCLPYLLAEIRMNYLSPEYLIEKVAAEGLIKMSEQCKYIVEEAKSYHLLKKRSMSRSFKPDPRLYTEMFRSVVCDTTTTPHTNESTSHCNAIPMNQNAVQGDTSILTANRNVTCGDTTTIMSTNQSVAQGDTGNLVTTSQNVAPGDAIIFAPTNETSSHANERCVVTNVSALSIMSKNWNVSNGINHGIYAVSSFTSIGTFVSYYDDRNKKWDTFSKNSQNDYVLHVVIVKDKLYVFFPNAVETFNLVTHEWASLNSLASMIKGAGIASYGNVIYIFGGYHFPNKIRCFDTQQKMWLQDETMKYPCRNMSVVSSPKKHIFFTGGYNRSCCSTFLKFHPITKQWTELKSMICPRMDHDSAILSDKIYVCGGRNSNARFLSSVEVYNKLTNQWTFVSYPKVSRHSLSLVSCGSKIYTFGGMTEKESCFCGVEVYDSEADKWLPGVPVPSHNTRFAHGVPPYPLPSSHHSEEKLPAVIRAAVSVPEE